jgi:tripartite-type tricarboxylate transporter receptor subunit TctC
LRRSWWALLFAASCATAAAGDAFPTRPIRLIVPYPAGGSTDIMARVLQEPMARLLGEPLVVENRPGAAGVIGAKEVARANPDGYTLLFANNGPVSIAPLLQDEAPFDPVEAFAAVSLVSRAPLVLVAHPSVPAEDVAGLVSWARGQDGGILYASAGPGSLGHLSTELLASRAAIKLTHVPYRGQAPTTLAVLSGEVQLLLTTTSEVMNGAIREGKLKLIGVSSREVSPIAPDAAPIARTLPGFSVEVWFGILAPAGTPADVVARLNAALATTLADQDLRQRFIGFGFEAASSSPQDLAAMIAEEVPGWRRIIGERGIKP